jgi:hypothetical protein
MRRVFYKSIQVVLGFLQLGRNWLWWGCRFIWLGLLLYDWGGWNLFFRLLSCVHLWDLLQYLLLHLWIHMLEFLISFIVHSTRKTRAIGWCLQMDVWIVQKRGLVNNLRLSWFKRFIWYYCVCVWTSDWVWTVLVICGLVNSTCLWFTKFG